MVKTDQLQLHLGLDHTPVASVFTITRPRSPNIGEALLNTQTEVRNIGLIGMTDLNNH
jgi:hypothetical protein